MPRGGNGAYTARWIRNAEHIEEGSKKKGLSTNGSESCAWATVNKHDDGGKKSGIGRKSASSKRASSSASAKRSATKGTSRTSTSTMMTQRASSCGDAFPTRHNLVEHSPQAFEMKKLIAACIVFLHLIRSKVSDGDQHSNVRGPSTDRVFNGGGLLETSRSTSCACTGRDLVPALCVRLHMEHGCCRGSRIPTPPYHGPPARTAATITTSPSRSIGTAKSTRSKASVRHTPARTGMRPLRLSHHRARYGIGRQHVLLCILCAKVRGEGSERQGG